METHHRSGPLKQKNKEHKSSKRKSHRSLYDSNQSLRSVSSNKKNSILLSRMARKNQMAQSRKLKREDFLNAKRGIAVAPILISILNYNENFDQFGKMLKTLDPSANVSISKFGNVTYLDLIKFRTQYQFILLNQKDLNSSLDLARISDILLIIHSSSVHRIQTGRMEFDTLNAIYSHCLPQTLHTVIGMKDSSLKQKDLLRKTISELIESNYPGTVDGRNNGTKIRLRSLDTVQDFLQLLHFCSSVKRKSNSYCERRSQVLAENIQFIPSDCVDEEKSSVGTLIVDGFVRNNPLNVDSLIYVPEFGEFQMSLIETVPIPYSNGKNKRTQIKYHKIADPNQRCSLKRENRIETIFEEEMRAMEDDICQSALETTLTESKKVPKGTSDYQAAWILDCSDDSEGDNDDNKSSSSESENEMLIEQENRNSLNGKHVRFAPMKPDEESDEEDEEMINMDDKKLENEQTTTNKDIYDQDHDMSEELVCLKKFKEQRLYEMFPDELDTPNDRLAKERFSKYRGLKSFRTSTWDCKENLPADYSRIFQFENFHRTRRRIFKTEAIGADSGLYVRVNLINVPKKVYDHFVQSTRSLVLFELLAHEHKMSVMNLVIKKVQDCGDEPIKSKDLLMFHVGCRRFIARPIFSAHTTGDKHKLEKFLPSDGTTVVATIFAPITFPPASVLVYRKSGIRNNGQELVATGSLLDCSPDRLVIKRIVLSGHPFKINRRHAVVRYMFFNRDDILWFRPIELRTKYGRRGFIQEPLGTHGHMKCIFNHQISSQDTVLMYLYKRVFPKWHFKYLSISSESNRLFDGNSVSIGSQDDLNIIQ